MTVRAKFRVESVVPDKTNPELKSISLRAVYDPDPNSPNGRFFKWTPAGEIRMACVNPNANEQFIEGHEMYVTFTPARLVD